MSIALHQRIPRYRVPSRIVAIAGNMQRCRLNVWLCKSIVHDGGGGRTDELTPEQRMDVAGPFCRQSDDLGHRRGVW